ncbi:unnamed protein product [Triticum turgidum subsp. durum]|uniref:Uncharacterized protein n=1 Tax=Triticum turgidum subsp. durum TaxID=4567 RepID=A0A9R0TZ50_TRITD|nr:unnamed protein product [Triticum turgidum subsp. durum]
MASSKFCLNIAGDTPSSNRLFDAIVSHCRLLGVLRVRPCVGCCEAGLPAAHSPRRDQGPVDYHVEKAEGGGSSL